MVSGINGNFSLRSLELIQNELAFLPTDYGEITEETQANLSADALRAISYFGSSKVSLDNKIDDLIEQNEAQKKQTSKEVSPDMDLNLDDFSIPKSKKL